MGSSARLGRVRFQRVQVGRCLQRVAPCLGVLPFIIGPSSRTERAIPFKVSLLQTRFGCSRIQASARSLTPALDGGGAGGGYGT